MSTGSPDPRLGSAGHLSNHVATSSKSQASLPQQISCTRLEAPDRDSADMDESPYGNMRNCWLLHSSDTFAHLARFFRFLSFPFLFPFNYFLFLGPLLLSSLCHSLFSVFLCSIHPSHIGRRQGSMFMLGQPVLFPSTCSFPLVSNLP